MYKITLLAAFLTFTYADCNFDNWQDYEPNLQNCDLSGQDLSGTDFSYMNLDDANLSNSNLASCDFTGASMVNADLTGVSIWNTVITDALMCGVDISGFDLGLSMPIIESDCFDVCGGSSELDECGVCDGDGTACFGCMDPFATNYSELAIYDDGSCEYFDGDYDGEPPSEIYTHYSPEVTGNIGWIEENEPAECIPVENNNILCSFSIYFYYQTGDDEALAELYGTEISDDVWLVVEKFDYNGELLWNKIIKNSNRNPELQTILFSEDSYYLNYLDGNGNDSEDYPYVAKISTDGNTLWDFYYDTDNSSTPNFKESFINQDGDLTLIGSRSNSENVQELFMMVVNTDNGELVKTEFLPYVNQFYFEALTYNNNNNYMCYGYGSSDGTTFHHFIEITDQGDLVSTSSIPWTIHNSSDLYLKTISQFNNGNYLLGGGSNMGFATMMVVDQNGNYLSEAIDNISLDLDSSVDSYLRSSMKTYDNKIILAGFSRDPIYANQALLVRIDQNMNIDWIYKYGELPSEDDEFTNVVQMADGKILASGFGLNFIYNLNKRFTYSLIHYDDGCMNSSSCNYNPYATNDNGSCYFEDICGVCDGNNYDFCDDDGDGVNNFEQYGYGAYNLSISDIPNDQGGRVYISFDNSYFDSDTLQSRSETYTIERKDGDNWVVAQSFGAYGADSYTVEVTTLENNIDNEFRVIASMDEGNFLSFETISGQSLDNIAPGQPNNLSASFESGQVALAWDSSLDNDFLNYNIYRQSELYATTAESTFADNQLPNIPLLGYSVSAMDVNGNESVLSDIDVLIYIDGDLNEDYVLNILDVVMMMEHIMGDELEDIQYADLNNDSAIDILDVVLLVQIILSENRADNE